MSGVILLVFLNSSINEFCKIAVVNNAYCLFLSAISNGVILFASDISASESCLPSNTCCLNSFCLSEGPSSVLLSLPITPSNASIKSVSNNWEAASGWVWAISATSSIAFPASARSSALILWVKAGTLIVAAWGSVLGASTGASGAFTSSAFGASGSITEGGTWFIVCWFITWGAGTDTGTVCAGAGVIITWPCCWTGAVCTGG